MNQDSWQGLTKQLQHEVRRGPLRLADAASLFEQAPDEPLGDELIERMVAETIRRARHDRENSSHWHFWIGGFNQQGEQRCVSLHVASMVGADAAVAQIRRTVVTPSWMVVSIDSLDPSSCDAQASVDPRSIAASEVISGQMDGTEFPEAHWEITTESVKQMAGSSQQSDENQLLPE